MTLCVMSSANATHMPVPNVTIAGQSFIAPEAVPRTHIMLRVLFAEYINPDASFSRKE